MITIHLDEFEGPLDLLLKLIRDQKMDILDIPIAKITDQYNEIIASWPLFDLENASDYIQMAAQLLQIKSRMLLPRAPEEEPEEDPREELAKQLALYAVYQNIARFLEEKETRSLHQITKDPEYDSSMIVEVPGKIYPKTLERAMRRMLLNKEVTIVTPGSIAPEVYSLSEKKELLQDLLQQKQRFSFRECFHKQSTAEEVITTFLALLELYKTGEVDFTQDADEIFLARRDGYSE